MELPEAIVQFGQDLKEGLFAIAKALEPQALIKKPIKEPEKKEQVKGFADESYRYVWEIVENCPIFYAKGDHSYPIMETTGEHFPVGELVQTEHKRHANDVDGQGKFYRIVGTMGNTKLKELDFNDRHKEKMNGYFIEEKFLEKISERRK